VKGDNFSSGTRWDPVVGYSKGRSQRKATVRVCSKKAVIMLRSTMPISAIKVWLTLSK